MFFGFDYKCLVFRQMVVRPDSRPVEVKCKKSHFFYNIRTVNQFKIFAPDMKKLKKI